VENLKKATEEQEVQEEVEKIVKIDKNVGMIDLDSLLGDDDEE